jgi:hypothetical protein
MNVDENIILCPKIDFYTARSMARLEREARKKLWWVVAFIGEDTVIKE